MMEVVPTWSAGSAPLTGQGLRARRGAGAGGGPGAGGPARARECPWKFGNQGGKPGTPPGGAPPPRARRRASAERHRGDGETSLSSMFDNSSQSIAATWHSVQVPRACQANLESPIPISPIFGLGAPNNFVWKRNRILSRGVAASGRARPPPGGFPLRPPGGGPPPSPARRPGGGRGPRPPRAPRAPPRPARAGGTGAAPRNAHGPET